MSRRYGGGGGYGGEDDDEGYTVHESRGGSRGGGGLGGGMGGGGGMGRMQAPSFGGMGGGGGMGRGGDSRELRSIDVNEAKRMSTLIQHAGESDFKEYILYVRDDHAKSARALDLLNGNVILKQRTYIQDVDLLRVQPNWMCGMPAIVDRAAADAHIGDAALTFISGFRAYDRGAVGQMGKYMKRGRRMDFDSGMASASNFTITSSPWDVSGTPAARTRGRVPRFAGAQADGKVGDREAQAWGAAYQSIEDSAKRWQHAK